jgi:hypothetical protein
MHATCFDKHWLSSECVQFQIKLLRTRPVAQILEGQAIPTPILRYVL